MKTVEKVSAILGILAFIGAIITGFLGDRVASLVMIALLLLIWQTWITKEVISLRKAKSDDHIWLRQYLDEPSLISSEKKNRLAIDSDFLFWEKCTLVMWVLVPSKEQGLRSAPNNRYLLAHNTGEARIHVFFNQFAVRYSHRKKWEFECSDDKAEYLPEPLSISDGVEPGWHHFLLAWDRSKPQLIFLIDGGKSGSKISTTVFKYWPERKADEIFVGTWVSDWEGHYCQTKLYQLWITNDCLESTDSAIKEHLKHKPQT